jgi:RHS repeat-associated protein
VDGTLVEKYLWQGLTRLLAVYDGNDTLLMRFDYADARMPVSMTKGGSTYYLTYDQVASLKVVADSSGNVLKRIRYDSFGNIINDTAPTFEVPFAFAGGLHDKDTGLTRFGYRDYDPDIGRWTAKDPILFDGGDTDLYGYCLSDPVNAIDPEGLKGGALIPIVKFLKKYVKGGDIIGPIVQKALSIPLTPIAILTYDFLNPRPAGVPDEDFLLYQYYNKTPYLGITIEDITFEEPGRHISPCQ